MNYYRILGVARNATMKEIKRAFRKRAKETHPDMNPENLNAEQDFIHLMEAYRCLLDPVTRFRYNATLPKEEKQKEPAPKEGLAAKETASQSSQKPVEKDLPGTRPPPTSPADLQPEQKLWTEAGYNFMADSGRMGYWPKRSQNKIKTGEQNREQQNMRIALVSIVVVIFTFIAAVPVWMPYVNTFLALQEARNETDRVHCMELNETRKKAGKPRSAVPMGCWQHLKEW